MISLDVYSPPSSNLNILIMLSVRFSIVGLMGPNPSSTLSSQANPYAIGTFDIRRMRTEVSPEAVWGDVGTKFSHPMMVVMSVIFPNLPSCRLISPLRLIKVRLLFIPKAFMKVSNRPSRTLDR